MKDNKCKICGNESKYSIFTQVESLTTGKKLMGIEEHYCKKHCPRVGCE